MTTTGWKSWMKTLEQLFEYGSFQPSHDCQKMCSSEKHIYDTYPKNPNITRYSNPEIPNKLGI